jgi:hypothetical protein
MQIYIKYKTKTTKHLIVYTTMTSKVYAYLNKSLVKYSVNVFFIIWRIFVPVNLRPLNRVRLSDFDSNTNIIKKSSPLSIKKNQKET